MKSLALGIMSQTQEQRDAGQGEVGPGTWLRAPLWKVLAAAGFLIFHTAIIVWAVGGANASAAQKNLLQDNKIEVNEKAITALEIKFTQLQNDTKKDVSDIKDKLGQMTSSLVEIKTTLQFIAPKPKADGLP